MVTLLPKNKPTPMAPPMAIMVSCRCPSRRCRPSTSGIVPCRSVIAANAGRVRVKDHQVEILLENFHDRLYIVQCVVHVERYPQAVVPVRGDDVAFGELLHQ